MSELSGKQVKSMKEAYASIYSNVNEEVSEEVSEENENEALMLEWYNALVEEGYIDGSKIEENCEEESLNEGIWSGIAGATTKYGPKVMQTLRKVTGFGLKNSGNKRRILTTGAGTATALDPKKAAQVVGGTATKTAEVVRGAAKGGYEAAVGKEKEKEKKESEVKKPGGGRAYIDPATGTIKYQ